jgi:hypothetical protein
VLRVGRDGRVERELLCCARRSSTACRVAVAVTAVVVAVAAVTVTVTAVVVVVVVVAVVVRSVAAACRLGFHNFAILVIHTNATTGAWEYAHATSAVGEHLQSCRREMVSNVEKSATLAWE